jgi:hypothetical protein
VKGGFNILNVNPANLATTLSLVKEYAPIVGRIQGLANIETQMGMQLKPNMDMDLATLTAGGLFNLFSGNLDVPSWMGEAAKQLQWGAADKMSLKPTKAGFFDRKRTVYIKGFHWREPSQRMSNEIGWLCRPKQTITLGRHLDGQRQEVAIHDHG